MAERRKKEQSSHNKGVRSEAEDLIKKGLESICRYKRI